MAYKFFDKKFLVMPDDEDIIGKKVFFADIYDVLLEGVESGDSGDARVIDDVYRGEVYPFSIDGEAWILAYYDPNYECKVAFSQGRQIQRRPKDSVCDTWTDIFKPEWCADCEYRVKPEPEPMFEVIKQDGVYKKVKNSLVPNFFFGTAEACDKWIAEHTTKTRCMTNKELARWCAANKGQYTAYANKSYLCTSYQYPLGEDNEPVHECIRIREWDSDEWHEPLVEAAECCT